MEYNTDQRSYTDRLGAKLSEKKAALGGRVEEKSPKLYSAYSSVSNSWTRYWNMTFPNYERKAQEKMKKLKQEGEQMLSEKEMEQLQEEIPEWKRSALQISEEKDPQRRRSLIRKLRDKMGERVKQTEQYKKMRQTDSYKKY